MADEPIVETSTGGAQPRSSSTELTTGVADIPADPPATPTDTPTPILDEQSTEGAQTRSDSESTTEAATETSAQSVPESAPAPALTSSDVLTNAEGTVEHSESQDYTTGAPPTPEPKPPAAPEVSDIKPQVLKPPAPPPPQESNIEPQTSTVPELPSSNIENRSSTDDIVAGLSDNDLKAASALWAKKNQAEFSKKGVAKRQETMQLNLRAIVDYLSRNNGAPLPRVAKHTNITLGTTSKYLRQLIASGKVTATGWGKNRRYYLK